MARRRPPRTTGRGGPRKRDGRGGRGQPRTAHKPREDLALPTRRGYVTVRLRKGRSTPVLAGHPWVFSGAIEAFACHEGTELTPGMPCLVVDDAGRWLGLGTYHAAAKLAVRVLAPIGAEAVPETQPALLAVVRDRLDAALGLRRELGLVGQSGDMATDAYRLVHHDGDGLPGLTIDRLGDGAVVLYGSAGAFAWRPAVQAWLREAAGAAWIVERTAGDALADEGLERGFAAVHGDVPTNADGVVLVREHGLAFEADPTTGQKTGYYADQRDNHARIERFVEGRFVVDAYCHQGGFGLHAARAGARRVIAVDMSMAAVEATLRNAARNGLADVVQAQQLDAVHALQAWADMPSESRADRPDVVIVDPPKFATRAAKVDDALRKYTHLNQLAMKAVANDGLLVSCSCSGRVGREDFLRMLALAGLRAGKEVRVLEVHGAALDHPTAAGHPEGRYLDVAFCQVRARIDHGGTA